MKMPLASSTPARILSRRSIHRMIALLITLAIFLVIFRRVPLDKLVTALAEADHVRFLALMIANTLFYFCWDTLILTIVVRWFHGPVRYRDLLPVRAASYVVGFFNTTAGRGTLAAYLSRRLHAPFLQIGSTVIFLLLTEYTHLVLWATLGIAILPPPAARQLVWLPFAVLVFWLMFLPYARAGDITRLDKARRLAWLWVPRRWTLFRTFRLAPPGQYIQVIVLRMPMFVVSLCLHYFAARSFGIQIPFGLMLAFLPVIFMLAALPITFAHLGTTQAAWIFFFGGYGSPAQLLAFSLAAHLTFVSTRALIGTLLLPRAYKDLVETEELRNLRIEGVTN